MRWNSQGHQLMLTSQGWLVEEHWLAVEDRYRLDFYM
jgi:hypothetical protein